MASHYGPVGGRVLGFVNYRQDVIGVTKNDLHLSTFYLSIYLSSSIEVIGCALQEYISVHITYNFKYLSYTTISF